MLAVDFDKKIVRKLAEGEQPEPEETLVDFSPFTVREGCWRCEFFVSSLVFDTKVKKYKLICKPCLFNAAKAWEIQ